MTDGGEYAVNQYPYDFGDNSPTVSHAFAATGTYPVSI